MSKKNGSKNRKDQLRQLLLKRRKELSDADYRKASAAIARRLFDQPEYQKARVIHCYVSMNDQREVDTRALIKRMMQEDKKVVVPRVVSEEGEMDHIHLTSLDRLEKSSWGILEPASGPTVYKKDLDMVIVPMAGGDYNKNRIGYGGGFYDRFLRNLQIPCLGLAFDCCLLEEEIPVAEHDVPLTKIITEKQTVS